MEGALWKETLLSWQQYYFVVETGMFRYHKLKEADVMYRDRKKPLGFAVLSSAAVSNTKRARPGRPHTFRIDVRDSDGQKWVLAAETSAEAAQWAKALETCGARNDFRASGGGAEPEAPQFDGVVVTQTESNSGKTSILVKVPSSPLLDSCSQRSDGTAPKNYFRPPPRSAGNTVLDTLDNALDTVGEALSRVSSVSISALSGRRPSASAGGAPAAAGPTAGAAGELVPDPGPQEPPVSCCRQFAAWFCRGAGEKNLH